MVCNLPTDELVSQDICKYGCSILNGGYKTLKLIIQSKPVMVVYNLPFDKLLRLAISVDCCDTLDGGCHMTDGRRFCNEVHAHQLSNL